MREAHGKAEVSGLRFFEIGRCDVELRIQSNSADFEKSQSQPRTTSEPIPHPRVSHPRSRTGNAVKDLDVAEFVRILTRVSTVAILEDLQSWSAIGGTLTRFRYKILHGVQDRAQSNRR